MLEPLLPAGAPAPSAPSHAGRTQPTTRQVPPGESFGALLEKKLADVGRLQFSSHALQRIERRGIELEPATIARLEVGTARAAAKGARDSLVLVDETAFMVSVKNNTVVTAVGREHMREQVFTNIDSVAIA